MLDENILIILIRKFPAPMYFHLKIEEIMMINQLSIKYLGIDLCYKVAWIDHTANVKSKLSKSYMPWTALKQNLTKVGLRMLYYTKINTYLQNGIILV